MTYPTKNGKNIKTSPKMAAQQQLQVINKGTILNPNAKEFHPKNPHLHQHNNNLYHTTLISPSIYCDNNIIPVSSPSSSVQLPHNHFHGSNNNFQYYYPSNNFSSDHQYHHHFQATTTRTTTILHGQHYQQQQTPPVQLSARPAARPRGRRFTEKTGGGDPTCGNMMMRKRRGDQGLFDNNNKNKNNIGKNQGLIFNGGGGDGHYNNNGGFNGKYNGSDGCIKHRGRGRRCRSSRVSKWEERGERKMEVMLVKPNGLETTAMIRNIPNQYTRRMLIKFLDEFCETENQKLIKDATDHSGESQADDHPLLAFDFVYLPIDFKSDANKGYAFVNFTHPIAVWKLHIASNNKSWKYCSSPKTCQIAYATIQGKKKLKEHFGNSRFVCSREDYLPICFSPPRDGSGVPVTQTTIGERVIVGSSRSHLIRK